MKNKAKPRVCEVLGVEVHERFKAQIYAVPAVEYYVSDVGDVIAVTEGTAFIRHELVTGKDLIYMINHPESIHKISRWTPKEVELAKAIKVVWPEANSLIRVCGSAGEWIRIVTKDGYSIRVTMEGSRFPNLKPDENVLISEII